MNRLVIRLTYENTRGEIEVKREDFVGNVEDIGAKIYAAQRTLVAAVKEQNS